MPRRWRCGYDVSLHPLRQVIGALTGPELDDPTLRDARRYKRVFVHDRFDHGAFVAGRDDDATVPWHLPAGHEERPGLEVLAQKHDVFRHVSVDLREVSLVDKLDDKHCFEVATLRSPSGTRNTCYRATDRPAARASVSAGSQHLR